MPKRAFYFRGNISDRHKCFINKFIGQFFGTVDQVSHLGVKPYLDIHHRSALRMVA